MAHRRESLCGPAHSIGSSPWAVGSMEAAMARNASRRPFLRIWSGGVNLFVFKEKNLFKGLFWARSAFHSLPSHSSTPLAVVVTGNLDVEFIDGSGWVGPIGLQIMTAPVLVVSDCVHLVPRPKFNAFSFFWSSEQQSVRRGWPTIQHPHLRGLTPHDCGEPPGCQGLQKK
ncbi:MAG: hypothetical protein CM15mP39_05310 [Synechococcus sp.]|nr:MAG: hypothetical protein CM15mP39_05310 [Synechococcus sp.]